MRAVEEGLPLVRAANNGISAVIAPSGRVIARLGMNERGSLDADLPKAVATPPYARFGDSLFLIAWLMIVGGLVIWRFKFPNAPDS